MINNFFQDFAKRYQMGFQDTASPAMSAILDLHSYVNFFIVVIFIVVTFQILDVLFFFRIDYRYEIKKYNKRVWYKLL
jgi:heme/copper-type cytochrome/quinol oxidase subunit 2